MPTGVEAFTTEPPSIFRREARMIHISTPKWRDSVIRNNPNNTAPSQRIKNKFKSLKPSSKAAEMGAFALLYPYGYVHNPFDFATYLQEKNASNYEDPQEGQTYDKIWQCKNVARFRVVF